ncbi:MAG: low molecular weight protein arginine phosphatase [Defluviitaleaceae bacterium]|nr:low molecular weight protein arginine phosphatase [Defluviitaleaceae bacterium]
MILFVCTGNTCRSPMAAVLAQKLLREAGTEYAVQSAGVHASPACAASAHAITAMRGAGCDLLPHRSQRATAQLVADAKLILTMTAAHRAAVLSIAPKSAHKVFTLCGYPHENDTIQADADVVDPFGGDLLTYQQCAAQIKQLIKSSLGKIIQHIREA